MDSLKDPTPQEEIRKNPEVLVSSERTRQAIAERGKTDLFYMASVVLGYNALTVHTHGGFCRFWDTCSSKRRAGYMPRTHFKTTIKTISGSIQDIVKDPNITILIAAATDKNASRFLTEIQNHFQRNEMLRWLYPDACYDDPRRQAPRWNKLEMEVPRTTFVREPTVDTLGAGSEPASRHYLKINLDDIIGEKEFKSAAEMTSKIEWLKGVEPLLVPPWDDRFIDNVGTLWKLDDAHAFFGFLFGGDPRVVESVPIGPYAEKRGRLATFTRSVRENGEPIFPEMYNNETLAAMQAADPIRFSGQMLNDPAAEGVASFSEHWLKYWNISTDAFIKLEDVEKPINIRKCPIFILCDPAISEKKGACRTAIQVIAADLSDVPRLIMLECIMEQQLPDKTIQTLFDMYDKYPNTRVCSIETVAYQKALKYWIEQEEARLGRPPLPIVTCDRPSGSKPERIKGTQPIFRAGQIYISPGFTEFIDEYVKWHEKAKYQDGMDCLAQILEYVDFGWSQKAEDEFEEFNRLMQEKRSILTGYW